MRYRVIALFSALPWRFLPCFAPVTGAQEAKNDVKGIFLLTDYPAVTLRPGTTSSVNLKLQNYAVAPERMTLAVSGVPSGWTATLLGGGQPVAAALPATNSSVSLELRLDVPKDAPVGSTNITVTAQGATTNLSLPIEVKLPARTSTTPTARGQQRPRRQRRPRTARRARRGRARSRASPAPEPQTRHGPRRPPHGWSCRNGGPARRHPQ